MGNLGKNSSNYWSVIKDTDTQPINTLKDKHRKLASTKQGTLEAAFKYFQDLFKAKPRTKPAEVVRASETPTSKCIHSKRVLHHIKKGKIVKAIKNIKNRKAAGPNGIPNEAFKIGAAVIAQFYLIPFYQLTTALLHGILGSFT